MADSGMDAGGCGEEMGAAASPLPSLGRGMRKPFGLSLPRASISTDETPIIVRARLSRLAAGLTILGEGSNGPLEKGCCCGTDAGGTSVSRVGDGLDAMSPGAGGSTLKVVPHFGQRIF